MSFHRFVNPCYKHKQVDASCHECGMTGSFEVFFATKGWYWWACWPGCLPDSEPSGPYATHAEAVAAANSGS